MRIRTLLLAALLASPVVAQQQPPSGQSRGSRSPDEYIKLLESEGRISGLQVDRVIDALQLTTGQRIADVGSGSGLFTRPLAKKLQGSGMVYAVDIDAELLKHVEKTAAEQKLANIKTILASETDARLPEPVDLIAIIDTLHHIANQAEYFKGLKKYLRPGGRVAVIDFTKEWPAGHEKLKYTVADLDGWMAGAGFKRAGQYDFLTNDFFVIYR